jgi:hypothetical protein
MLDNGKQISVSTTTKRHSHNNKENNRGQLNVLHGDLYSNGLAVIKVSSFVNSVVEERGLLNANQFGFRAPHSRALQFMRLTGKVSLNFNNNMSTAAVFLDNKKAFDTTWHSGLLYKLSKIEFSTSLIKLISSFLSQRKFSDSVEGEISTPRERRAGLPQGSVLPLILYNMYTNDSLKHLVFS